MLGKDIVVVEKLSFMVRAIIILAYVYQRMSGTIDGVA